MNKKQASQILNLRLERINALIKDKKIEIDLTGKLSDQSVYEYLKELNERRNTKPTVWLHRNEF